MMVFRLEAAVEEVAQRFFSIAAVSFLDKVPRPSAAEFHARQYIRAQLSTLSRSLDLGLKDQEKPYMWPIRALQRVLCGFIRPRLSGPVVLRRCLAGSICGAQPHLLPAREGTC